MKKDLFELLKKRRSNYDLTNKTTLNEEELTELIQSSLLLSPSAFNSQTARAVLLLNDKHLKLWDIVLETLKEHVPEKAFRSTQKKIDSFKAAHGTILFFEEWKIIEDLEENFPLYKESFPQWAEQSSGILSLVVWTALAENGMGSSLQHYNPLIDEEVKKEFSLPASWRLIAQMPFGVVNSPAGSKESIDPKERFKLIK